MIPGIGRNFYKRDAPKVTFLGSTEIVGSGPTFDFGTISVPRNGLLVVGITGWRTGAGQRQVNTISIAGSSAAPTISGTTQNGVVALRQREVTAGNVAITATLSGSMVNALVHTWLIENYTSTTAQSSNNSSYGSTSVNHQISLDYLEPSVGILLDNDASSAVSEKTSITPNGAIINLEISSGTAGSHTAGYYTSQGDEVGVNHQFEGTFNNGHCCGLVIK